MSEGESLALKEALYNQYVIIKRLYQELEEEREASSTAANEALSMILRLQREKAAEKMEACQYKRMTEERLHHAEECVVTLEEASQQKDIENSILKNQLQAYKHKLMSLGISFEFADTIQIDGEDSSLPASLRRNTSLPSLTFDESSGETDTGNEISPVSTSMESIWKTIGGHTEKNKENHREITSLTSRTPIVRQYSEESKGNIKHKLNSGVHLSPILTGDTLYFSTHGGPESCLNSRAVSCSYSQAEEQANIPLSAAPSVASEHTELENKMVSKSSSHDIFEALESDKSRTSGEANKLSTEPAKKIKAVNGMEDIVPPEAYKYLFGDKGKLRKDVTHTNQGSKFLTASKDKEALGLPYASVNTIKDNQKKSSEKITDFEEIKSRLEQLEDVKMGKLDGSGNTREQLQLLDEIYGQLNTIQNKLKRSKSKERSQRNECPLVSVMEAVLSFSI